MLIKKMLGIDGDEDEHPANSNAGVYVNIALRSNSRLMEETYTTE